MLEVDALELDAREVGDAGSRWVGRPHLAADVTLAELGGDDVDFGVADSRATYSSSGWKATAMEAGRVQGVVVQMMVLTFLPASAGSMVAGSVGASSART